MSFQSSLRGNQEEDQGGRGGTEKRAARGRTVEAYVRW